MIKVWAFSDTHTMHGQLQVPVGIDVAIFAGDCSNIKAPAANYHEVVNFLYWYNSLDIPSKLMIAGNHDTSIEKSMHGLNKLDSLYPTIKYIENNECIISKEDKVIKLWGSPFTPRFGEWSFMKDRGKIDQVWQHIPENLDILITHGPPKGILDLSIDRDGLMEQVGDTALYNRIQEKKPKKVIFGHIHNYKTCRNQGVFERDGIEYMNVSCVTDAEFDKGLTSNGIVFEI